MAKSKNGVEIQVGMRVRFTSEAIEKMLLASAGAKTLDEAVKNMSKLSMTPVAQVRSQLNKALAEGAKKTAKIIKIDGVKISLEMDDGAAVLMDANDLLVDQNKGAKATDSFFTRKVIGPVPMWGVLSAGVVTLLGGFWLLRRH